MVTVIGNAKMTGIVGQDMVTVFGDAEVDGPVNHDLVVVFGNLKLGPNAVLSGDCVVVFGAIDQNAKAVLNREAFQLMPLFSGLGNYFRSGPLLGRIMPPALKFVWIVAACFFLVYLLTALILPKQTAAGVKKLEENLFLCWGIGVLIMILFAPAMIILIATGVGILLVPFVLLAALAFGVLGKASTMELLGLQILRRIRPDAETPSITAFLIGFLIVTIIYMIPVLGLLVWMILQPLALGAAALSVFGSMRKNGNGTVPVIPGPSGSTPPPSTDSAPDAGNASQSGFGGASTATLHCGAAIAASDITAMPRAGFWIRTAATALDFILLGIVLHFADHFFLLVWAVYHIAMWTWRGTTIGGIICRLKVVRTDGRPLDFGVALVRALSSILSAVALCLGFFAVGWSRTCQSWHDMIADTVIVRVPHGSAMI
jgi:uncharacterized RDD family membrane protein YckC